MWKICEGCFNCREKHHFRYAVARDGLVVTCDCGLNYTLDQFRTLPLIIRLAIHMELRECVCGLVHAVDERNI